MSLESMFIAVVTMIVTIIMTTVIVNRLHKRNDNDKKVIYRLKVKRDKNYKLNLAATLELAESLRRKGERVIVVE